MICAFFCISASSMTLQWMSDDNQQVQRNPRMMSCFLCLTIKLPIPQTKSQIMLCSIVLCAKCYYQAHELSKTTVLPDFDQQAIEQRAGGLPDVLARPPQRAYRKHALLLVLIPPHVLSPVHQAPEQIW